MLSDGLIPFSYNPTACTGNPICNDYVDDYVTIELGYFFGPKNDSKYLHRKLIFFDEEQQRFCLLKHFLMQKSVFNQCKQLKNQMAVETNNFGEDKNYPLYRVQQGLQQLCGKIFDLLFMF